MYSVTRTAAEARGITLDVQVDPAASGALCDSVRMQQVVWNLVSNAVKFTPKGGHVRVTLSREGSSFQIQVSDTGQGISLDLFPYVFDRFRQADSSMRRRFAGLGLGFRLSNTSWKRMAGRSKPRAPGQVKVRRLPFVSQFMRCGYERRAKRRRSQATAREEELADSVHVADRRPPVRLDGISVLVVDDEADARRVLMMVLERAGAIVTTAGSARAAIEVLPKARPNVLVSDLGMPDQDGFDLIRQAARQRACRDGSPGRRANRVCPKGPRSTWRCWLGFRSTSPSPSIPHELTSVIARLARGTG